MRNEKRINMVNQNIQLITKVHGNKQSEEHIEIKSKKQN